jgi:hypothetical protein
MSRVSVDWRSGSKESYVRFCKEHSNIKITYDEWRNILYSFNESYKEHILETGDKLKLPFGFGEFSINKKKRKRVTLVNGKEYVNLPVDWQKTKEKGKIIYNFNYHTEGYFFGWHWFKATARFKHSNLWYFKPCRVTSRLLSHYLKTDDKYQHIYKEYNVK